MGAAAIAAPLAKNPKVLADASAAARANFLNVRIDMGFSLGSIAVMVGGKIVFRCAKQHNKKNCKPSLRFTQKRKPMLCLTPYASISRLPVRAISQKSPKWKALQCLLSRGKLMPLKQN